MPSSQFISILLVYSILFLRVCCFPTDVDASADFDSSPQQQPPAVDYDDYDSPSTSFFASNNPNSDSAIPTSTTDTTYGINNNDLDSSSSQPEPSEQQANGAIRDGFGPSSTLPNSTGPLLLVSNGDCDNSENSGGKDPNARANKNRKKKRQLRNCPNPYLTSPNPQTNSIKTLESDDENTGRTQSGEDVQAPAMAIPGLIIQKKPEPNLSLCPDVERPIPVCGREDTKVPMGDSFLLPKCRACKLFFNFFL